MVAGVFLQETAERIFRNHGGIDRSDLFRGCGFIRLLGIQAGCDSFLLSSITRRCDGKCTAGAILCPIADVRRICFRDILGVEDVYRSALPRNTGEKTIGRKPYHYPVRRDTLHSDTRRRNDFDGERGDGIFQPNQFLNHSAINPCFSLIASLSKQQDFAAQFNFFPEEERKEVMDTLSPHSTRGHKGTNPADADLQQKPLQSLLNTSRPNILIILMESFSANAIGAVGGDSIITPNLNRLSREGVLFTNMYANSFRTDRGIVSVLNGYLAQPTTSIMKYPAKSQTLPSIAKTLTNEGYVADMLYGGDINFTNMQSYFFSSGYSRITADRDFPLTSRLSKWGANDDITFRHLYEDIKNRDNQAPWLSTFLTLSSHEPFEVPYHRLDEMGLYPNSVAFTDSCIGNFIDKLKELPVWKNTLVIFVSDHGYPYPKDVVNYEPRRYHIPMLWIGGAVKEPVVIDKLANQTDLAATLLNQLGIDHDTFTFSRNILSPDYPEYAFYTYSNGFGFIDSTGISVYDNEGNKPLIEAPRKGSDLRLRKGKALLQTLYDDLGNR